LLLSRCGGMQTKPGSCDAPTEAGAKVNGEDQSDNAAMILSTTTLSTSKRQWASNSRIAVGGMRRVAVPGGGGLEWLSGDAQDGQGC
jgi:hypothetical protein